MYRQTFSGGWRQWELVKEDFIRGGGGLVPPATGGLPGGVASMSFAWHDMASETRTHSREEPKKRKAQGIPSHSWSTTRSAAASCQSAEWRTQHSRWLRYTFLQIPANSSFSALPLPGAVHAKKDWIPDVGSSLSSPCLLDFYQKTWQNNSEHTMFVWQTCPHEETIWALRTAAWQSFYRGGDLFSRKS